MSSDSFYSVQVPRTESLGEGSSIAISIPRTRGGSLGGKWACGLDWLTFQRTQFCRADRANSTLILIMRSSGPRFAARLARRAGHPLKPQWFCGFNSRSLQLPGLALPTSRPGACLWPNSIGCCTEGAEGAEGAEQLSLSSDTELVRKH